MIGWDLFSGIGGIKCGMALAGIKPVLGVELDTHDPSLSEAFIKIHLMNGWRGTRLETVQEFADWGCPGLPHNADIAHISPVCADYSMAKSGAPRNENKAMIRASMDAIEIGRPRCFTLEQVPMYRKSPEFAYMQARAIGLGYTVNSTVLNIGSPFGQSRVRLVVTAALHGNWESPLQPDSNSWYEVVEDLIPAFAPIVPTPRQRQAVLDWQARNPDDRNKSPLYVERVTCGEKPKARGRSELIPTLLKSKFRDGAENGRSKISCLYFPASGDWLNFNLEAHARLSGFPDTFRYPNTARFVGAGFGYSVPPLFYSSLIKTMPK